MTSRKNTTCIEAASDGEILSSQLFAILSRQVSLARRGKVDEVLTLAGKIDRLLSRANRKHLEKIWAKSAIRSLYDELCLILGAAKHEVADELERVRKGKSSLRAYKGVSRRQ